MCCASSGGGRRRVLSNAHGKLTVGGGAALSSHQWSSVDPRRKISLLIPLCERCGSGPLSADRGFEWHRAVAPVGEVGEITSHGLALSRPRRGFESRWGHHQPHPATLKLR